MHNIRLRWKMSVAFLATALIPIAIIGLFSLRHTTQSLTETILDSRENSLHTRASRLKRSYAALSRISTF